MKQRVCTVCNGMREIFELHTQMFKTCWVCFGRGYLFYEEECACGLPILWVSDDKIRYCGNKDCLKLLQADARGEEVEDLSRWTQGWSRFEGVTE